MLLQCENNDKINLFVDADGDGCLSKRGGAGIRMASEAWMRRDALHSVEVIS